MAPTDTPHPHAPFRFWLALGFAALFIAASASAPGPGITWDEPIYLAAGYSYCTWFNTLSAESFSRAEIDRGWAPNHEHPPAAKLLYGATALLGEALGLNALFCARFAAAALFTALAALLYFFVAAHFGPAAGVLAAAALVLMPRVFGDGHLAALDMPVSLAIFATTVAFVRAKDRRLPAAFAGVLWGIALLTKLNAIFVPVVLVPWALWRFRSRAVLPALLFLAVGGATFFVGWPWLWHNTASRVREYATNKTERLGDGDRPTGTSNIPVFYLGRTYRNTPAPWHYPFVLTLVTVPLGLLVFAGLGIARSFRSKPVDAPAASSRAPPPDDARPVVILLLASALLPLLVIALPMVPKYDGVRLFLPAFPFLAAFAGIGAAYLWARARVGKAVIAAALLLETAALAYTHPCELSYYNPLVAGAWGANKLGFETTYWGDTVTTDVIRFVNEHCPDNSTLAFRPPYLDLLIGKGNALRALLGLKESLAPVEWKSGTRPPDFLILFPRQGHLDEPALRILRGQKPLRAWTYLGVPQCYVFDLRETRR